MKTMLGFASAAAPTLGNSVAATVPNATAMTLTARFMWLPHLSRGPAERELLASAFFERLAVGGYGLYEPFGAGLAPPQPRQCSIRNHVASLPGVREL